MPDHVSVLNFVNQYGGPAALEGLSRLGSTVVCHAPDFDDAEKRAAFEAGHPGMIASVARTPEELVEDALSRFGRLDAIVANEVGNSMRGPITDRTADDFRAVLETYTVAPFRLVSAALPTLLKQGGGRIVLITSGVPLSPRPNLVLHSAARAATNNLVATLAAELGPSNISINAIAIIYLLSHFFPGGMSVPEYAETIRSVVPMQRFGEPSEMARLVELLASGKADFISGQVIAFSGGAV